MILKTTLLIAVFFFCSPSVFTQTSNPLTPAAQKQTSPTPPSELPYGTPGIPISVLENTLIRVITDQPLSTKRSKDGMPVTFSVNEDVVVNHALAIPRGATSSPAVRS